MSDVEQRYMEMALQEAGKAADRGEVPVGAVLVDYQGNIIASDGNRVIEHNDPSGHAEMVVLRKAAQQVGNYRLTGTTLYVTLEPCVMCAGAMVHARVDRLVFGTVDPKAGAVVSLYQLGEDRRLNHSFAVEGGLMAAESAAFLRDFFRSRRG